uniref:Uncharacterized protein n=1 Tax=viral metagenome TaxID=1070528 RepID=A0A6C0KHR1_9ZZZZ
MDQLALFYIMMEIQLQEEQGLYMAQILLSIRIFYHQKIIDTLLVQLEWSGNIFMLETAQLVLPGLVRRRQHWVQIKAALHTRQTALHRLLLILGQH